MDACPSTKLPPGVASTRLPAWLLPNVPPDVLKRLRPDMLIIHGLDMPTFHACSLLLATLDSATLTALKSTCTIHLVELTYTSDDSYNQTLHKKKSQHFYLASLLLNAGWTLANTVSPPPLPPHLQAHPPPSIPHVQPSDTPHPPPPPTALQPSPITYASRVHILILTHSCTLSCSILALLTAFSVPHTACHTLLTALSIHTVRSTYAIVTARRHIERISPAESHCRIHPYSPVLPPAASFAAFPPAQAILRTHDPP